MRLLKRLFALLCWGMAFSPAGAQDVTRHYEYVFFLRGKPMHDVEAQATAALPATLTRHSLVTPTALRQWNGQGHQIPLAMEQRSKRLSDLPLQEIFDTGEPLADVLGMRDSDTVTMLAVMVGIPQRLDVPAYIEALALAISVAKAVRSPAFVDNETNELRRTANLQERQRWGLRGEQHLISASNPPTVTVMGGITQIAALPEEGVRSQGLRKLGLPDVALERGVPGYSHLDLIQMTGNLLITGKASPASGATLIFRTTDLEVAGGRLANKGGMGRAKLVGSTLKPGPVLRIEFDGEPQAHEFERQMLFYSGLWGSRYPALSAGQEKTLLRALAKAKAQTLELWPRLDALRRDGTKVFFAFRMDTLVASPRGSAQPAVEREWHEFIGGMEEGRPLVRRWAGDPRKGGAAERMPKPYVIDGRTYEFIDSDLTLHHIDDVLVIDPRGNAKGGEVLSLVRQLVAETPSSLRR